MEVIRGKKSHIIEPETLKHLALQYPGVLVDIGTGDGRFIFRKAEGLPDRFFIGVDACRDNMRDISRKALPNTIFLIANALELPLELSDLATHITINFPWGSLLSGLLAGSSGLLGGLVNIARPGAHLEVRLNAGSLAEAGWTLDEGAARIRGVLWDAGFLLAPAVRMEKAELLACPTTWSRRLAFGRDPRARLIEATKINPFR